MAETKESGCDKCKEPVESRQENVEREMLCNKCKGVAGKDCWLNTTRRCGSRCKAYIDGDCEVLYRLGMIARK